MGDVGDTFAGHREASQIKRASNRESSAEVLTGRGVSFESKNGGAHLIVTHEENVVDFWPGTGLWIDRQTGTKKRGVFRLLDFIGS